MTHIRQVLMGNLACGALLVSACMHVSDRFHRLAPRQEQVCFGIVLSLGAMVLMMLSVRFEPSTALIEGSTLFGGPALLLLSILDAGDVRLFIGGENGTVLTDNGFVAAFGLPLWWLVTRGRGAGLWRRLVTKRSTLQERCKAHLHYTIRHADRPRSLFEPVGHRHQALHDIGVGEKCACRTVSDGTQRGECKSPDETLDFLLDTSLPYGDADAPGAKFLPSVSSTRIPLHEKQDDR